MTLCEFMQRQIPDLQRVPWNVESFGKISVVEYGTYLFYFITSKTQLFGQHPILKEKGTKRRKPPRKAQFVLHFCVSMESEINWQDNTCNRLFKVPMKRIFFLMKEHKKLEDCPLPFLNILFGSRVTKL